MNDRTALILEVSSFIVIAVIAFYCGISYEKANERTERTTLGLFTQNTTINGYYYSGYWIHVNVDNMNITESTKVCNHEVAHMIYNERFANKCEDNMSYCEELVNGK